MSALAGTDGHERPAGLGDRPFTALLTEDDRRRADALSSMLASLAGAEVRIIRVGSPSRSHLMLERILAPIAGVSDPARLADNARLITRTIAERQGRETRVVLLIRQAERLRPAVLHSLQAMAPHFVQAGQPTLHVAFIGRPEFRALLDEDDLAPLRQALGTTLDPPEPQATLMREIGAARAPNAVYVQPDRLEQASRATPPRVIPAAANDDTRRLAPIMRPRPVSGRGRMVVLGSLAAVFLVATAGIAYVGLHRFFYRVVPIRPPMTIVTPAAPAVSPPSSAPAAFDIVPPPIMPPAVAPRSILTERPVDRPTPIVNVPALPEARLDPRPNPRSDPRIVIHIPAGSVPAETLSAQLLRSLGSRPGSVEARRVADTPARPNIRYFYPEDESAARQAIAWMADTGLTWTLRDFSTFQPRPSRGTIEVWLPRTP